MPRSSIDRLSRSHRAQGRRQRGTGGGGDIRVTVGGAAPRWSAGCRALLLALIAACAGEDAMPGAGTISCVAGRGPDGAGGDGGPDSAAELGRWLTIAVDAAGNVGPRAGARTPRPCGTGCAGDTRPRHRGAAAGARLSAVTTGASTR